MLLHAFADFAAGEAMLEIADIGQIPQYAGETSTSHESEVLGLQQALAVADAAVLATPEFNHSFSGAIKNAIDWTSMPASGSVWAGKPVAVVGAASSFVGTARAQPHLRQVLFGLGAQVFPFPELLVNNSYAKFHEGTLVDEDTAARVSHYVLEFVRWARIVKDWKPKMS